MSVYLVTGAAGFIGSNIVEELVMLGEKVIAVDNLATGRESNIRPFLDKITFHLGMTKQTSGFAATSSSLWPRTSVTTPILVGFVNCGKSALIVFPPWMLRQG